MNHAKLLSFLAAISFPCSPVVAAAPKAAPPPAAPWVSMGADGLLKYRADALGNRIPDFSMVGYGTGTVPLPGTPGGTDGLRGSVPGGGVLKPSRTVRRSL